MNEQTNIERDILTAAKQVFLDKGFSGATTTEIAAVAGCNQSLVHYYFRTKENLFQQVFVSLVNQMLENVFTRLNDDSLSFEDKIRTTLELYFDILERNPKLPFLLLNELILNKERRMLIKEQFIRNPVRAMTYMQFCNIINSEAAKGNIRQIDPFDLLLDVVSLTASTFLSLSLYSDLLERNDEQTACFLKNRKQHIIELIINGIGLKSA